MAHLGIASRQVDEMEVWEVASDFGYWRAAEPEENAERDITADRVAHVRAIQQWEREGRQGPRPSPPPLRPPSDGQRGVVRTLTPNDHERKGA